MLRRPERIPPLPASMPTATSHFPIKPRRCYHCTKTFLAVPPEQVPGMPTITEGEALCWHCMQRPFLANIKKVIDEALKDVRPKVYLRNLERGIAAG
jgi:hypothetical protein